MSYQDWAFMSGKTSSGVLVTLRSLHIDDVEAIGRWMNSEEMRQVLNVDYPVTWEKVRELVQDAVSNRNANSLHAPFAISIDRQFVGCCGLHDISLCHRHATFGIYIGEESKRNGGVGSVVYRMLLNYAFRELDLRIVRAFVNGNNEPSKRLHLTSGFTQVGCTPEWENKNNQYVDELTYCITKKQWLALHK